jgi:hypothetical protein
MTGHVSMARYPLNWTNWPIVNFPSRTR